MDETHIGPTTYSICYADVLVTSRKHKKETSKDHRMIEIVNFLKVSTQNRGLGSGKRSTV